MKLTKTEVQILLERVGLTINDFSTLPNGDAGLKHLYSTQIKVDQIIPLFVNYMSLEIKGGQSVDGKHIVIELYYSYTHCNGGSNGKIVLVRSEDGGENFRVS